MPSTVVQSFVPLSFYFFKYLTVPGLYFYPVYWNAKYKSQNRILKKKEI